jgi:hypothetical protein
VTESSTQSKDGTFLRTLGWALFLGVSWTWCIGMFLPVLLVRDYGVMGWVAFAIPNVVGAGLMGWVLAKAGASERVAWAHRGAGVFFSVVTIAFHVYWIYWVVAGLIGWAALVITPALAVVFYIAGRARKNGDLLLAAGVWVLSLTAMVLFALLSHPPHIHGQPPTGGLGLVALASVCLLGFALNPYLDLTFLRARQATEPRQGIVAFGVGFGICFCLMIVFTLLYARLLLPGLWGLISPLMAWGLAGHMMVQAAFTVSVHAREVARRWPQQDSHVRFGALGAVAASFLPLIAGSLGFGMIETGEQIYRLFMAFYALVFPAYVWMLMIPRRGERTAEPTRGGLVALAVVLCVAGPMFWVAFIGGKMAWLLPGIGVILLGRFAVPRSRPTVVVI